MSKERISDYLENYNKTTSRGSCKVCSMLITWKWERVGSHKRNKCTSEEDRIKFTKPRAKGAFHEEFKQVSQVLDVPDAIEDNKKLYKISEYLLGYDTGRGQCKSCYTLVKWSRDRVASHKRSNCPNVSDEERAFFALSKPQNPQRYESYDESFTSKMNDIYMNNDNHINLPIETETYSSDMQNHKDRCRLCICDPDITAIGRYMITEETQALILELQIELTFTRNFSDFICENCHQNLLQISYFRQEINEKQHQLTEYLSTVNHQRNQEHIEYPNSSAWYDSYDQIQNVKDEPADPVDSVVIEPEVFEDEIESFSENRHVPQVNYNENTEKDPELYKNCHICGKSVKENTLRRHIFRVHTKTVKFICDFCGNGFVEKSMFARHIRLHIPLAVRDKYECDLCPETYYSTDGLRRHKNFKHFNKLRKVAENMNQEIPCHICGKIVKRKYLFRHMNRVHRNILNFFCDFCGKGFYDKRSTEFHVRSHIPAEFRESFYECEKCEKQFYTIKGLRTHKRTYHPGEESQGETVPVRSLKTETEKTSFLCSDCGKVCEKLGDLKRHLLIHQEKSIACDIPGCNEMFREKYQLKKHKDFVHLKVKKYACDVEGCGKNFITPSKLLRHVKTMHECKTKCPVEDCKYRTSRISYMKHHLSNRHLELEREYLQILLDNVKNMDLVW